MIFGKFRLTVEMDPSFFQRSVVQSALSQNFRNIDLFCNKLGNPAVVKPSLFQSSNNWFIIYFGLAKVIQFSRHVFLKTNFGKQWEASGLRWVFVLFSMLGRESRWRRGMEAKLWISSTCSTGRTRPWWRPSASRTLTGGCAASTAQRTAKVEYGDKNGFRLEPPNLSDLFCRNVFFFPRQNLTSRLCHNLFVKWLPNLDMQLICKNTNTGLSHLIVIVCRFQLSCSARRRGISKSISPQNDGFKKKKKNVVWMHRWII